MRKILITGATGQIGSELTPLLRRRYGADNVIAAGHRRPPDPELSTEGPFYSLDIRDAAALEQIIKNHQIDTVFHLAALLSAVAETKPQGHRMCRGTKRIVRVIHLHGYRNYPNAPSSSDKRPAQQTGENSNAANQRLAVHSHA